MRRQKKQLMLMFLVLILAIIVLVLVLKVPEEETNDGTPGYQVTELDKEMINKFSYTNESGMYNLIKQDGEWICEDNRELDIDETVIDQMIGKVAALTSQNRVEQVEDIAQYGLDAPAATILISDGTTGYTILVGGYNDLVGIYYLCLESDMETVYSADSYTVSDFIEKGIDELVVIEEDTSE